MRWKSYQDITPICRGLGPGGSGGVGPPLESGIYVIKKNFEKLFLFIGTPLDKNRSVAPANLGKNDFSPKNFLTIDYIDK